MKEIIQFRVSLHDSKPMIWRRFLVHQNTSFFVLHQIIQAVMGWKNYHLFEFGITGYRIGPIDEEETGYGSDKLLDAKSVKLKDLLNDTDLLVYLYDFGDNWKHQLDVEQHLDLVPSETYPFCLDGEMNCPPEDCGGIHSFYDCLRILQNKRDPAYHDITQWFPKKYDPKAFDKERINRLLKKIKNPQR